VTWIPFFQECWAELSAQQKKKLMAKAKENSCFECNVARLVPYTHGMYDAIVTESMAMLIRNGKCISKAWNQRRREEAIEILPACPLNMDEIVDEVLYDKEKKPLTIPEGQAVLLQMEKDGWICIKARRQ
jgi:hypothetical protein